jgi:hypothetical protein
LSPKFATNNNEPSGVNAIAEGFGPVRAVECTEETDPLLRSMVSELSVLSPVVATHIKPVPDVVELFVLEQLLKSAMANPATSARTQDFLRILLPEKEATASGIRCQQAKRTRALASG